MNRSKRIASIVKLSKYREQRAARSLGDAQSRMQKRQDTLHILKVHKANYLNSFSDKLESGACMSEIREYRAFLDKLDCAIGEQRQLLDFSQDECQKARHQWTQDHVQHNAINNIQNRAEVAENKIAEKREQARADEWQVRGRQSNVLRFQTS